MPSLTPSAGLYLNYALNPLVIERTSTDEEVALVEHAIALDLLVGVGLFDVFQLGVALPVSLYQSPGDDGPTLATRDIESVGIGDLRIIPKLTIVHDPFGFGLGVEAIVSVPTGSSGDFQGNGAVAVEPRVVLGWVASRSFRVGLNVGAIFREKMQLGNLDIGRELTFGAAAEYRFDPDRFGLILEGYGKLSLTDGESAETPVELSLAARWWPASGHALTFGVARGLTNGYGSPDLRLFLGYQIGSPTDDDPDKDGIRGSADECPDDAEDRDEFEDADGCPDPDNDQDGIPDASDKCPNDAEDKDGFEDEDGCPDLDRDHDGIPDESDKCPTEPEDFDKFQDEDGCPEKDNDNDQIDDAVDKCIIDPEDYDGWLDEDGCPEADNDGDGIMDAADKCPDDPKDKCRVQVLNRCEIKIMDQVFFKTNSDVIDVKKSAAILEAVADILRRNKWIKQLEVQGHTDSNGPDDYNMDLSNRRAASVSKYLSEVGRVEPSRLTSKGYGETAPRDTNKTSAGRANNRRVQFKILEPSTGDCK